MNLLLEAWKKVLAEKASGNFSRDKDCETLYSSGKTLEQIAYKYGITRERVRQILKRAGLTKEHGGAKKRSVGRNTAQAIDRQQKRESRALRFYGCEADIIDKLNYGCSWSANGSRTKAYFDQRRSSLHRGINWDFTFPDWCRVWDDSGKWSMRGRRGHMYCMSRLNDSGPYAKGNVKIRTNKENIQDSYRINTREMRLAVRHRRDVQTAMRAYEMRERGFPLKKIAADLSLSKKLIGEYIIAGKQHKKNMTEQDS